MKQKILIEEKINSLKVNKNIINNTNIKSNLEKQNSKEKDLEKVNELYDIATNLSREMADQELVREKAVD